MKKGLNTEKLIFGFGFILILLSLLIFESTANFIRNKEIIKKGTKYEAELKEVERVFNHTPGSKSSFTKPLFKCSYIPIFSKSYKGVYNKL